MSEFFLSSNVSTSSVSGFLNWMIHIYKLRGNLDLPSLEISQSVDFDILLNCLYSIELFGYISLINKHRSVSRRIFMLFRCLYNELLMISKIYPEFSDLYTDSLIFFKKINKLAKDSNLNSIEMFNKFYKILNNIVDPRNSLKTAFDVYSNYFSDSLFALTENSYGQKQFETKIVIKVSKNRKNQICQLETCINFLCASSYNLMIDSDISSEKIVDFFLTLLSLLNKEGKDSIYLYDIDNLIHDAISHKLSQKLYKTFFSLIFQKVVALEEKSEKFAFMNSLSFFVPRLIRSSEDFKDVSDLETLSDFILRLITISGSGMYKIPAHAFYRNRLIPLLNMFITYLNDIKDDISIIRHRIFMGLINWLPYSHFVFNESSKRYTKRILLRKASSCVSSLKCHLVLNCINMVVNDLQIDTKYLTDLKNLPTEEFLKKIIKILSSFSLMGEILFTWKLQEAVSKCMATIILCNPQISTSYLIEIANESEYELTWVLVMDVLCIILCKAGKMDGISEDVIIQPYEDLIRLITTERQNRFITLEFLIDYIGGKDVPVEFISAIISLFSSRGKLKELMTIVAKLEVEKNCGQNTVFRSNSLSVSFFTTAFKMYGQAFAKIMVDPLSNYIAFDINRHFEIDPQKVSSNKLEENRANMTKLIDYFSQHLISLIPAIPKKLSIVCHALYEAIAESSQNTALKSVGSIFFLRLINPLLLTPSKITPHSPSNEDNTRAGLLLSKVIQCIANQTVNKDYMESMNTSIQSKYLDMITFLSKLCRHTEDKEPTNLTFSEAHSLVHISIFIESEIQNIMSYLNKYKFPSADISEEVLKLFTSYKNTNISGKSSEKNIYGQAKIRQSTKNTSRISSDSSLSQEVVKLDNILFKHGTSLEGNDVVYIDLQYEYVGFTIDKISDHFASILNSIDDKWDLVLNTLRLTTHDKIFNMLFDDESREIFIKQCFSRLSNIFITNLSVNLLDYFKKKQTLVEKYAKNKNIIIIVTQSYLTSYISPKEIHQVFASWFHSSTNSYDGNYFHSNAKIFITQKELIIKYREKCPISSNIHQYHESYPFSIIRNMRNNYWDIFEIELSDGSYVTFSSQSCSLINEKLRKHTAVELSPAQSMKILPHKETIFDSFGICLSSAFIFLLNDKENVRRIAKKFLKCLVDIFDKKLLELNILKYESSSSIFEDISELNENISNSKGIFTFGVIDQYLHFILKSDQVIQRFCFQLLKPWIHNIVQIVGKGKSKDSIKIFQLIENLTNITIVNSRYAYELKEYVWTPMSLDLFLTEYILKSFIKISIASVHDSRVVDNMLISTIALARTYIVQVTNSLIEGLTRYIDANYSYENSFSVNFDYDDVISTYIKFFSNLLNHECLYLITTLPLVLYYSLLNLMINTEIEELKYTCSFIYNCLETIANMKSINISDNLTQEVKLVCSKYFSLLTQNLSLRKQSNTIDDTNEFLLKYADICENYNIELVEYVKADITKILKIVCMENPSINWHFQFIETINKYAFSFYRKIQHRAVVLLNINENTCPNFMQNLLKICSKGIKEQEKDLIRSSLYCIQKLVPNIESRLESIFDIFWIAFGCLMMLDEKIYCCCLRILVSIFELNVIKNCQKLNEKLVKYLSLIDKKDHMRSISHYVGINFDCSFTFSFASLLVKGTSSSNPNVKSTSIALLKQLFNLSTAHIQTQPALVNSENFAYYTALIPYDNNITESIANHMKDTGIQDDTSMEYIQLHGLYLHKDLKDLELEQILSLLIIIQNIQNCKSLTSINSLLNVIWGYIEHFKNSARTCHSLMESSLMRLLMTQTDTYLLEHISRILSKLHEIDQPENDSRYVGLTAKGFFGFVSVLSSFNKDAITESIWRHLSKFVIGLTSKSSLVNNYKT